MIRFRGTGALRPLRSQMNHDQKKRLRHELAKILKDYGVVARGMPVMVTAEESKSSPDTGPPLLTPPVESHAAKKGSRWRSVTKPAKWFVLLFSPTMISLYAALLAFFPQFDASVNQDLDGAQNPFQALFTVQYRGPIPLRDIRFSCGITEAKNGAVVFNGIKFVQPKSKLSWMLWGDAQTITCPMPFAFTTPWDDVKIILITEYSPFIAWFRGSNFIYFSTMRGRDGKLRWYRVTPDYPSMHKPHKWAEIRQAF